jgi:hypothetical protein
MGLIGASQARRVNIFAFNSDGSPAWSAPETWPIPIGMGITLTAPNIYFNPPTPSIAFQADGTFGGIDLPVTLQGDPAIPGDYIHIGVPLPGNASQSFAKVAVENGHVSPGWYVPLSISNAWLQTEGTGIGIDISGGSLTLGPLPVHIGSNDGRSNASQGYAGLLCSSGLTPVAITDEGNGPLQIDSQDTDMFVTDGCSVVLGHGPRLGRQSDGGYRSCPAKADGYGLNVGEGALVMLGSSAQPAIISCQTQAGIYLSTGAGTRWIHPPVVYYEGSVENSDCVGAYVGSGLLVVSASTVSFNQTGLWVDRAGTLSLEYGTDISCNGIFESPVYCIDNLPPGVGILNTTSDTQVDAEQVGWNSWSEDAGQPQVWHCSDQSFAACLCSGSNCPAGGAQPLPTSGADAVYLTASPAFIFDGGSMAFDGSCP